jgi:hypothetical protein
VPAEDGAGGYVITEDFVLAMLSEFKEQRLIHRRFAFQILLQVRLALSADKTTLGKTLSLRVSVLRAAVN